MSISGAIFQDIIMTCDSLFFCRMSGLVYYQHLEDTLQMLIIADADAARTHSKSQKKAIAFTHFVINFNVKKNLS